MHRTPHVALLIETARGYGRDVALGIARYARLHGPWSFHLRPGDFQQKLPVGGLWQGDGVFARLADRELAEQLVELGLPTVALDMTEEDLRPESPFSVFTDLRVDSLSAARLAAEHLLERDFKTYGFVGTPGKVWSDRRQAKFCEFLREKGYETHVYEPKSSGDRGFWESELPRLADWLASLPKPIGIMACNDEHGLHVLDACRIAGARAPEEVAVVGVDDDTLMCELCNPTLSSVVLNGVEGGYRAAQHLEALMRGDKDLPRRITVEALRVEARLSTNVHGFHNPRVVDAIAYIRKTAGRGIDADSIAEQVQVPRRDLDNQFRESIGRSVAAEIQRARLERAKRLLEETDYPIPKVAEASGYSSASYMIQVFRRELATTPAKYRSRVRSLVVSDIDRINTLGQ